MIKMNHQKNNYLQHTKKSQSALEFIMLFSFVFLIFMAMFIVFNKRLVSITKESEEIELKQILDKITTEIEIASTVHNGYIRKFSIPKSFLGYDYKVLLEKPEGALLVVVTTSIAPETVPGSRERVKIINIDSTTVLGDIIPGENTLVKVNNLICFNMDPKDCVLEEIL